VSGIWHSPTVRDIAFAVFMAVLTVLGSIGESNPKRSYDQGPPGHPVPVAPWWAYLLVAAASLALIWRRRHPVPVLVISTGAVVAYTALGYVNGAALLAPAVALYTVATRYPARRAIVTAIVTFLVVVTVTAAADPFGALGGSTIPIPGLFAAVTFAGIAVANRRAYVDSIRARAELAERGREQEVRSRVDAERLRIARELHDVVAHTMAMINVQAGVAAHVSTDLPPPVSDALQAIKEASKGGLRELRAILAVLRQVDDDDTTSPTPGLADLDALVAGVSAAGLRTTCEVTGTARALPPAVDLAAYRIVQESLTNALRHAGPASAVVLIGYGERELRLEVTDTGSGVAAPQLSSASIASLERGPQVATVPAARLPVPTAATANRDLAVPSRAVLAPGTGAGPAAPTPASAPTAAPRHVGGSGHGLVGMRERSLAVGGTLATDRTAGGGFRVRAHLPLDES
jgi:signal transduction histidine kinase